MKVVFIVILLLVLALVLRIWLRRGGTKPATVRGEVLVTGVQEQWRTGNSNDDKVGREYDVRLTVDVTLTTAERGTRKQYDVTVRNHDLPKLVAGARFPCDVNPADLKTVTVYVRAKDPERFENGR